MSKNNSIHKGRNVKVSSLFIYKSIIIIFSFILYFNTIKNDYSFDDDFVNYLSPSVKKGISGLYDIFTSRYYQKNEIVFGYRPLVKATLAIEYQFLGINPHFSHFINILLYCLTGLYIFMLLSKIILKKTDPVLSLVITLLFLSHPLHTEVVASIKNREEILCFLGGLLFIYYAIDYMEERKTKYLIFSIAGFLIGILSKLTIISFIVILPLTVYFFCDEDDRIRYSLVSRLGKLKLWFRRKPDINLNDNTLEHVRVGIINKKKPGNRKLNSTDDIKTGPKGINYFILVMCTAAIVISLFQLYTSIFLPKNEALGREWHNPIFSNKIIAEKPPVSLNHKTDTILQRRFVSDEKSLLIKISYGFKTLLFYMKKLIIPSPLLFYYGYNMLPLKGWADIFVISSVFIHLLLFVYSLYCIPQKSFLSYAILYYFITISMFTNIVMPVNGIVGERLVYISSFGYCMLLGYIIYIISQKVSKNIVKSMLILSLIIIIPYSIMSINRNKAWHNKMTLYESDIEYLSQSATANMMYANDLQGKFFNDANEGRPDINDIYLAEKHYKRALTISPKIPNAWNNLGVIYSSIYNKYKESIPFFIHAADCRVNYSEAYCNLGINYDILNVKDSAEYYFKLSISADSLYKNGIFKLADFYKKNNDSTNYFILKREYPYLQ